MTSSTKPENDPRGKQAEIVGEQDSLIEFPCDFPIKVMGASVPGFAETIGAAVREIVRYFREEMGFASCKSTKR